MPAAVNNGRLRMGVSRVQKAPARDMPGDQAILARMRTSTDQAASLASLLILALAQAAWPGVTQPCQSVMGRGLPRHPRVMRMLVTLMQGCRLYSRS